MPNILSKRPKLESEMKKLIVTVWWGRLKRPGNEKRPKLAAVSLHAAMNVRRTFFERTS